MSNAEQIVALRARLTLLTPQERRCWHIWRCWRAGLLRCLRCGLVTR